MGEVIAFALLAAVNPSLIAATTVMLLVQLLFIEIPMLAFKFAPTQTPVAIERAKEWARTHGRKCGVWGLVALGAAFAVRGVVTIV
jgi:hypothetical protein